jgi:putative peptidoglycan lipid II flippase
LRDTRTPLRFAIVRVILTTILGYLFAIPLPKMLGMDVRWGAAGLTISAGIASWVEFALLRHTLNGRIGRTGVPRSYLAKLWAAATIAAAGGWAINHFAHVRAPIPNAMLVLTPFGCIYFGIAMLLGIPEARSVFRRIAR